MVTEPGIDSLKTFFLWTLPGGFSLILLAVIQTF